MIADFPIAPPIEVQDGPTKRRLEKLEDARAYVDEALAFRRTAPWRDVLARIQRAQTAEDAIEAVGALRELLALEGLLVSSSRRRV